MKINTKFGRIAAGTLAALTVLLNAQAFANEVPAIEPADDTNYGTMLIGGEQDAEAEEKVVYVKADGNESNDGTSVENAVPSIQNALDILGMDGGTIYIVGEVALDRQVFPGSLEEKHGKITIAGYDDDSLLSWNYSMNPNGDVTIEYLNIRVDKNWSYLNARGSNLVLGKGINVTRGEGITNDMAIRGGGDTNVNIDGDTNIKVYSGTYSQICGGSRNGVISGDTHITIYGGTVSGVYGGNNNGSEPEAEGRNVKGNSYITIYGGAVTTAHGSEGKSKVEGTRNLDVSRYAEYNSAWFANFDVVKEYDPNITDSATTPIPEIKTDGSFINGYTDGTFQPENIITRAEAITIISRLLANDDEIKGKYTTEITDVSQEDWYYSNVAYLDAMGALESLITKGEKINPKQPITREEVCELVKYVGKITSMKVTEFTDLTSRSNKAAIFALASKGIVNGYDNGDGTYSFKPKGTITRAEFVTIIDRLVNRNAVEENIDSANKFTDIGDHWAKNYIVIAANQNKVDDKEVWKTMKNDKKFELPQDAKTSAEYIKALKGQIDELTTDEIQNAVDSLAEKRINEIRNTETNVTVSGTSYYVSADGDDSNDGKSPETAWKTLAKVSGSTLKSGDGVFFRRGDTFRGQLSTKNGVTYSAYGEGAKPNIFGWNKNSADPSLWTKTEVPGVWVYAEAITEDVGNIIFNDETNARKIIRSTEKDGTHKDYRANRTFNDYNDMTEDMTFFHDSEMSAESGPAGSGTGKLYLKCDKGNPGEVFESIEIAKKVHVIIGTSNVKIDNLCVAYGGAHGISAGKCDGLTVTNCEFKWIGGSLQTKIGAYNRTWPTPYGNAIEIYGEAKNYTVDNCYIWQAYDAGVTHQGSSTGNLAVDNVYYTNNVIEKCVYDIEIFYGESINENDQRSFNGTYIENNILRKGGGFGHYARPDTGVTALIRNGGILNNTTSYIVRNNIFDRSLGKLVQAGNDGGSKAQYYDNIYIQKYNGVFCTRLNKTYTANETIADSLKATETETNPSYILVEEYGNDY